MHIIDCNDVKDVGYNNKLYFVIERGSEILFLDDCKKVFLRLCSNKKELYSPPPASPKTKY